MENQVDDWADTIQAIRGGRTECFREIVIEFQDKLRFVVAYHIRGDAEKIDEVVHCAFIEAYRNLDRFDIGKPFWPWLKQIGKHEALKEVRRQRRSARFNRELIQAMIAESREDADAAPEWIGKLRACIDRLQSTARDVVRMHYFEGKDFESIAAALGKSAGALRVSMVTVRRALRQCMERAAQ